MYKDVLIQVGLTNNEAIVYDFLLQNGESSAGLIIKKTPLKRGVVYNVLAGLVEKGFILEKKKKKISYFSPNHPEKLRSNIEDKKEVIKKAQKTLEANLPAIISDFNLVSGKPGIRCYEGLDGVKKVLTDTLLNNKSKQILTFSDVKSYMIHLKAWNQNYYAPLRRQLEIHEKALVPDHPEVVDFIKDYLKNPKADILTEVLLMDHKLYPFSTEVNIYDNKVSFVTFLEKAFIGVIIENKEIFEAMTAIFNYCWGLGKKNKKENQF